MSNIVHCVATQVMSYGHHHNFCLSIILLESNNYS